MRSAAGSVIVLDPRMNRDNVPESTPEALVTWFKLRPDSVIA
jgi:hypothetical protein